MVEGAVLIAEAAAAGWRIEAEFVAPGVDPVSNALVHELAPGVIERVATTTTPQGALAIVAKPTTVVTLESLSSLVVTDRLADPGNLGTILRSAEAAGFDAVALTPGSVDPFNPKVVRASAGALFRVPTLEAALVDVAESGLRLFGTSSHLGTPHTEVDWSGRIAIAFGNEAHGLDPSAPVDEWVTIRHRGGAESLNVAMAATVLCFEAARHRP